MLSEEASCSTFNKAGVETQFISTLTITKICHRATLTGNFFKSTNAKWALFIWLHRSTCEFILLENQSVQSRPILRPQRPQIFGIHVPDLWSQGFTPVFPKHSKSSLALYNGYMHVIPQSIGACQAKFLTLHTLTSCSPHANPDSLKHSGASSSTLTGLPSSNLFRAALASFPVFIWLGSFKTLRLFAGLAVTTPLVHLFYFDRTFETLFRSLDHIDLLCHNSSNSDLRTTK